MLKPAGTLSFAVGSLSAAAGIGGGATGASFAAASLSAGRPIKGEPGGSGAPAAGAAGLAAGGVAGCWAAALSVNTLKNAPASQRLRDADVSLFMDVLPDGSSLFSCRHTYCLPRWAFRMTVSDIFPSHGNRKHAGRHAEI